MNDACSLSAITLAISRYSMHPSLQSVEHRFSMSVLWMDKTFDLSIAFTVAVEMCGGMAADQPKVSKLLAA